LTNLQELFLDNNRITEVPKELLALTNLQLLNLSNNQIT
jgi:Leucine-rich repeat (LRR) protein